MSSITVLGLDSALSGCSVALVAAGQLKAERHQAGERGQAECLLPMIEATMAAATIGFPALDLIAVTIGPGAFTGLRIGLAAAHGLALGAKRPVAGVTTLEAVAAATEAALRRGRTLVVALETKRRDLYLQAFTPALQPLTEPQAVAPERFEAWAPSGPLLIAGDGADRLAASLRGRAFSIAEGVRLPEAALVARIAALRHGSDAARPGTPLYLHAPDVTMPTAARTR
ncbi:MAG: tRNA (adenosine(37)-N6)-threonylcarbamoyltransferase complex dimerization subunit type 1 TsaB [Proteobacteria bacterium]|nr:tRNA (adenosine(37)-N6)-threonylcarbamoyltransferase complex dimerization subunit type 1 TsaB [Pseudomonadota bacterium]MBI3499045.1 tRNA (adenosine(37)-N6)-threonylcarbamoyltransferase complex dimerization subunit type 1 TsaB [Pseudomonadota bacterium]